jgi:uncharacterized protein (TIGR00251 family)
MALTVSERHDGVRFAVRVQPRASSSGVCGVLGDALKVRLSAAPVDGAANEALVDLLAASFGVGKRAVRIVAGTSGRSKVVDVDGVRAADVLRLAGQ